MADADDKLLNSLSVENGLETGVVSHVRVPTKPEGLSDVIGRWILSLQSPSAPLTMLD